MKNSANSSSCLKIIEIPTLLCCFDVAPFLSLNLVFFSLSTSVILLLAITLYFSLYCQQVLYQYNQHHFCQKYVICIWIHFSIRTIKTLMKEETPCSYFVRFSAIKCYFVLIFSIKISILHQDVRCIAKAITSNALWNI